MKYEQLIKLKNRIRISVLVRVFAVRLSLDNSQNISSDLIICGLNRFSWLSLNWISIALLALLRISQQFQWPSDLQVTTNVNDLFL